MKAADRKGHSCGWVSCLEWSTPDARRKPELAARCATHDSSCTSWPDAEVSGAEIVALLSLEIGTSMSGSRPRSWMERTSCGEMPAASRCAGRTGS